MLVDNPEYMEDQLKELRNGKVRLRCRVMQCTDDELYENRNFFTDYAVAITERQRVKKQQDEQQKAKVVKDNLPVGASEAGRSREARPESRQPPTPRQQPPVSNSAAPTEEQRRKKKKGESEASTMHAMEVRAMMAQIEGSHKNFEVKKEEEAKRRAKEAKEEAERQRIEEERRREEERLRQEQMKEQGMGFVRSLERKDTSASCLGYMKAHDELD